MFFRKNKTYQMDMDTANAALQNILAACDKAPNTIPFDKIVLRQKANTKAYNTLLIITAILLLFTFLSPLTILPATNCYEHFFPSEPVALVNDYVADNILYLEFTGDNILYSQSYMETLAGERIYTISYDAQKGLICFPYDAVNETNIYIPIEGSEPLHLLLSPIP